MKRNTNVRFPVVPASGVEAAADSRSPSFTKPPIPSRSHYRMASGHSGSFQGTNIRRPNVSPLILGNERNRSNSENVLQKGSVPRNRRMGIVPRKMGLSPLEESSANRNSLHLRGTSHGSALRERHGRGNGTGAVRSVHGNDTLEYLQQPGTFIRRLSSVPEQKLRVAPYNQTVEGAKGLLFSLHALHPYISSLLPLVGDEDSKRSSLERVFYNSSTHLDSLDHELHLLEIVPDTIGRQQRRSLRTIRRACRACIVAYMQVGKLLIKNAQQILSKGDRRYIRILLLLIQGSNVEAMNALNILNNKDTHEANLTITQVPSLIGKGNIPKLTVHGITPTQEKSLSIRSRSRHEPAISSRNHPYDVTQGHNKPATHPQSAVPLYLNGRSRSNSRSYTANLSSSNSAANTPGSGESFLMPGTPVLSGPDVGIPLRSDLHNAIFERLYIILQRLVEQGHTALPIVCSVFRRCLESTQATVNKGNYVDLWARLYIRSRQTMELCDSLDARLSTLKLSDLDIRGPQDVWTQVTWFANSFVNLCEEVRIATATDRERMAPLDTSRLLKPVLKGVRAVMESIKDSPWSYVLTNSASNQHGQAHFQWQNDMTFGGVPTSRLVGHHRTRDDSGSGLSPFMPATPLSAALGPAAQATIPIGSGSNSFDRSFQGDVFQRAEFALTMQHSAALHRRN